MPAFKLRYVVVLAALATLALAVTHVIAVWLRDRDPLWLEAGSGRSIFELAATATLGLCAASAVFLAVARPQGRRGSAAALATGLTIVFLVDLFALSDDLGAAGDVVLVFVLAGVFALLWSRADVLVGDGASIRVGLLLLALSVAIRAADPLTSAVDWEPGEVAYEMKVVIKHAAELTGWIFIASGLVPAAFSPRSRAPEPGGAARAAGSG